LLLVFAVAEITVLGSGLKALDWAIQKHELKFVKPVGRRFAAALRPHIAAVAITFAKDKP
jgi:hypothetical protein